MPFGGIITTNGHIIRGAGPVAQVLDDRKRRALLAARDQIVTAWGRRIHLGDAESLTRAEARYAGVHVECYGRLPRKSQPVALSPRELHRRQVNAKLRRLTAQSEAHRARRERERGSY